MDEFAAAAATEPAHAGAKCWICFDVALVPVVIFFVVRVILSSVCALDLTREPETAAANVDADRDDDKTAGARTAMRIDGFISGAMNVFPGFLTPEIVAFQLALREKYSTLEDE